MVSGKMDEACRNRIPTQWKRNRPAYYAGEKKKDNKIKNEKERKNRDLLSAKLGRYKYGMDIGLLVFLEFGGEDEAVGNG